MSRNAPERLSLLSRLGWFALLYVGGVLAVFALATVLHLLLNAQL